MSQRYLSPSRVDGEQDKQKRSKKWKRQGDKKFSKTKRNQYLARELLRTEAKRFVLKEMM